MIMVLLQIQQYLWLLWYYALFFYFSKKYAIKNDDTIAGIAVFLYMVFMFSSLFTVSPTHIPQYGTQTQKEMMAFVLNNRSQKILQLITFLR